MKIALIKNGTVEHVILGDFDFCAQYYPEHLAIDVSEEFVGPGFLYHAGDFSPPIKPEPELSPEEVQQEINEEAEAYLAATDKWIIREMDNGVPCPEHIKVAREQARLRIIR